MSRHEESPGTPGDAHGRAREMVRLRALSELARLVGRGADVATVLGAVCETIACAVGFATAVVNLREPGSDELVVRTVHGPGLVASELLGSSSRWSDWAPLLDERYRRLEAFFVPAGAVDWREQPVAAFVPEPVAPHGDDGPDAWQPEDALFVVLRDSHGGALGVVSVDEPVSGRRPSDEDVDLLCAVAAQAGLAIDKTQKDAALRASEALKSAMFDSALDAIISFDADGRIRDFNSAAEAMFGYERPEAIGADIVDLLRPVNDDARGGLARYTAGRVALDSGRIETVVADRDGREVTVELALARADTAGSPVFTAFLRDISERVAASRALVAERDRAQGYLDVAQTMMLVLDRDGTVTLANRKTCEVVGRDEADLVGCDWFETCSPPDARDAERAEFARLMAGAEPAAWIEAEIVVAGGERRRIVWHDTLLRDEAGAVTGMLSSGHDVTEYRAAQDRIAFLAYHDELTGLANRAHVRRHLDAALEDASERGGALAVLYVDLDGFKLVNDGLGHTAGDALLRAVAERLQRAIPRDALLARVGGDEFVVVVSGMADDARAAAATTADALLAALDGQFRVARVDIAIGASIGISAFPGDGDDAEQLFNHADVAMFAAKQAGRGRYCIYEASRNDPRHELSIMGQLRKALDRDEFELHYQPLVTVASGEIAGVEALIRWRRRDGTLAAPGEFIGIAEQTGFIEAIGRWVIDDACRQAAEWHAAGHRLDVAFNVSPHQLLNREIEEVVARALREHGVAASAITIELTETALGRHDRVQLDVLDALDSLGVRLAIDDFGAGYSSLSRLRALRFDALKVDRSFLADACRDPHAAQIVSAIVQLAHGLGMTTIAEGVEHADQMAFLSRIGCISAQGFHLGRPAPAATITALLEDGQALAA